VATSMHRILVCVLVLALPKLAHADCAASPELRTYYKPDKLPDKVSTRCDVKNGKCAALELKGWLYVPKPTVKKVEVTASRPILRMGDRPPLFIWNHGSEEMATGPGDKCDMASYFRDLGFVVFVPHRRGHGKSTGVFFDEYTTTYCSLANAPKQVSVSGPCKMEYLHTQVDDIEEAIKYVKGLKDGSGKPLVDATRIVIAGYSFGGITSVFANMKNLGQKVVLDGGGGSQSWEGNESARDEMKKAVASAVAPIYFFEPMNDRSIDATIELSRTAGQNCRQYQATLFPAVNTDTDDKITKADYATSDARDKAHGSFGSKPDVWGPAAIEFINRYFETPAQPFDTFCKGTSSQP
jgi:dienelactone hydrolase